MTEGRGRWQSWARGLARRWACRRPLAAGPEFVWLRANRLRSIVRSYHSVVRPITVRVVVQPSIVLQPQRRPMPAFAGVPSRRSWNHATPPGPVQSIRASTLNITRWMRGDSAEAVAGARGDQRLRRFSSSGGNVTHRQAATMLAGHTALVAARAGLVGAIVNSRSTRAVVGRRGGTSAFTVARVEPLALAPPPMVARRPGTAVAARPIAAVPLQRAQQSRTPFASIPDEQAGWPLPLAPSMNSVLSPAAVATLTEQVVREIDGRVRAKRERLGKV